MAETNTNTATNATTTDPAQNAAQNSSSEVDKLKNAVTKANAEAAEWRRKAESLSQEIQAKAANDQAAKATAEERIAQLERALKINNMTSSYLELGYDKESAKKAAEAFEQGNVEEVLKIQKAHEDALLAKADETKLAGTPLPPPQKTQATDKLDISKMSLAQLEKYITEHPEAKEKIRNKMKGT